MSAGRRFELIRTLGAGAYGTVYLADMVSSGDFRKKVAVKLLKAQPDAEADDDAARRLRDEARLLGRLRHRHIVQVDDLIRLDGQWAVVMEYVAGLDLEVLLKHLSSQGEALPLRAAAEVIHQSAAALDAAWNGTDHEADPLHVIHRDIKPSNLRLTATGDVKVLDFGIARVEMDEREAATGQYLMGTMAYIAPERLLGDPEAPSGDVYSLGCVLYELIVGGPLGRVQLAPARQQAQVADALAVFRERVDPGPGVDGLLGLLEEMLSYTAAGRPTSAQVSLRARDLAGRMAGEGLAQFSARVLPGLIVAAGQTGEPTSGVLQEGVTPTLTLPTAAGQGASLPEPAPAKKPWAPWAGVGGAVALAAVAVLALGQGDPAPAVAVPALAPAAAITAPVAAPAPGPLSAPEPAEPEPSEPAPAEPVRAAPAPVAPKAEPVTVAADAVRLRAIKFVQEGGGEMSVRCGDVSGSGSASVLLRHAPSGRCTVTVDGQSAAVTVSEPRGVNCTLGGGALTCR